jgi:hypothetical protein
MGGNPGPKGWPPPPPGEGYVACPVSITWGNGVTDMFDSYSGQKLSGEQQSDSPSSSPVSE